jgi:phosphoglycolate phosphatase
VNLLFDLDGTLTDPFAGITNSILHSLGKLNRPLPERDSLKWCIGPPLQNSFAQLLDTEDTSLIDSAITNYRQYFGTIGLFENSVYEGIVSALKHFEAQGHQLFIATSKPEVYAKQILDHFGLTAFFAGIHGSELNGIRNDKTELIQYLLKQQQLSPQDCVMLGDRKHDMIGATANNVRAVGVLWGYGSRQELLTAGADSYLEFTDQLITSNWTDSS